MTESENKQSSDTHTAEADATESSAADPSQAAQSDGDAQAVIEAMQAKAKENWEQLLRAKAEYDNLQKRHAKELEDAHKYALERFINELLPVRDSMEMGMAAATDTVDIDRLKEGMELTLKMLTSCLDKFGVEVIEPAQGDKLNPELHQAMSMQESAEVEPNCILNLVQKGYSLNGRLVRPAMVMVAKAVENKANETAAQSESEAQNNNADASASSEADKSAKAKKSKKKAKASDAKTAKASKSPEGEDS